MPGPVFVTGAGGFLGKSVCAALSELAIDHVAITRSDIDLAENTSVDRLSVIAEKRGAPSIFLHLAARKPGRHDLNAYARDNVVATANVLDFCFRFSVPRFLLASTLSVYAASKVEPIDESGQTFPHNGYIASKIGSEDFVRCAKYSDGSAFLILRLPSLYGLGQGDSFVDGLARKMQKESVIDLFNRGESIREVLPVGDAARAICSAVTNYNWADSRVMNIGCGQKVSSLEFATELGSQLGFAGSIRPSDQFASSFPNTYVSIAAARTQLNFSPTPWREALADYARTIQALT